VQYSGKTKGSRRLCFEIGCREERSYRLDDALLRYFDDRGEAMLQNRPVALAEAERARAIRQSLRLDCVRDQFTGAEGSGGIVCQQRLRSDHLHRLSQIPQAGKDAGRKTAPADQQADAAATPAPAKAAPTAAPPPAPAKTASAAPAAAAPAAPAPQAPAKAG